jgi:hypothetical protein
MKVKKEKVYNITLKKPIKQEASNLIESKELAIDRIRTGELLGIEDLEATEDKK